MSGRTWSRAAMLAPALPIAPVATTAAGDDTGHDD